MIYISGGVNGSYRAQNIIKTLLDNKVKFVYLPSTFSTIENKYIRKLVNVTLYILFLPIRIILISTCSTLIVLPMNANKLSLFEVIIARLFRKIVVYEYYISLFDALVNDRKELKGNTLNSRIALFYDKSFSFLAHKIICLNHSELRHYKPYMSVNSDEKTYIIPLVVDSYQVEKEVVLTSTIHFCWWGTYIPLHGLELIIESFSLIKERNVKLHIFGDSIVKSRKYQKLVNNLGLENIVSFNHEFSFKNGLLPDFLSEHKVVAFGIFGNSCKAKSVLPNKIADACSLSLPILTARNPATDEFFTDMDNVIYAERTAINLASKIDFIAKGGIDFHRMGNNSYRVFRNEFSPQVFQKRYIKMLNE